MDELDRLRERTGTEVHGLLVGRSESRSLGRICTEVHDFLGGWDDAALMETLAVGGGRGSNRSLSSSSLASWKEKCGRCHYDHYSTVGGVWRPQNYGGVQPRIGWGGGIGRNRTPFVLSLQAKYSTFGDEESGNKRGGGGSGKKRKKKRTDSKWDNYDDDDNDNDGYTSSSSTDRNEVTEIDDNAGTSDDETTMTTTDDTPYDTRVTETTSSLLLAAADALTSEAWDPHSLSLEREQAEGSCWRYRGELRAAVERVAEGLVERD